jgi:hypothetical protein
MLSVGILLTSPVVFPPVLLCVLCVLRRCVLWAAWSTVVLAQQMMTAVMVRA